MRRYFAMLFLSGFLLTSCGHDGSPSTSNYDADRDGVRLFTDLCPDLPGVAGNAGCPHDLKDLPCTLFDVGKFSDAHIPRSARRFCDPHLKGKDPRAFKPTIDNWGHFDGPGTWVVQEDIKFPGFATLVFPVAAPVRVYGRLVWKLTDGTSGATDWVSKSTSYVLPEDIESVRAESKNGAAWGMWGVELSHWRPVSLENQNQIKRLVEYSGYVPFAEWHDGYYKKNCSVITTGPNCL